MSVTSQVLRVHEKLYIASGGRVGHKILGVPTLLLHTTGRRSGKERTNGLVYARDGDDYLVVASNGGADRAPAWLPPALLDKLHDAQLFRLLLPRSTNGIETDPITFFHVIETIAKADASTAWCLSQAGGCAMSAAYLDLPVAQAIFGDPRAVLAWGPGPRVRAVECEGGYRVTGVWSFASGGRHATWLGAHCPIHAADGSPKYDANGAPLERTMLVRSSDVEWTDIWNTVGLRGTASDQFALNDFFVRADHSIIREFDRECREPGPLYRMSNHTCYQVGFAGVACGIARTALDNFVETMRNKVPRGTSVSLRDNAVVQCNLAQAEVNLRAARGYVLQSMADTGKNLARARPSPWRSA